MSFRDGKIQSDSESQYRPQGASHVDISQGDLVTNPTTVISLAQYDSTYDNDIPRRLAGIFPEQENDVNSQRSSSDTSFRDVPLCDSSVKSSEVDLVRKLTCLSPCSPRRQCNMQQRTKTKESNSVSAPRCYLHKTGNGDIGSPGECAVEHLDTQLSQLRVNLPSVEDGLSSGSELDVQGSDELPQQNYSEETDKTTTPNTNCQLNCILHDSTSRSTTHSLSSSPIRPVFVQSSLVNPPLVQDIFGIMRDIKQALSEDANATTVNARPHTDVSAARADDHTSRNNQSTVVPSYPEFSSNANTIPSATSTKSITSIYGRDIPTTGNCSRITVKASIEHQCDNSVPNDLPPEKRHIPSIGSTEAPQRTSSVDTDKCAHHWRFPEPSNVAYSSDDDIAPIRPAATVQRLSRSSGHRTTPRCQAAPPVARHQQCPVSDSPSYLPAPIAHECEAGDTEKLLAHTIKPDNPISAPELKQEDARQVKRQQSVREVYLPHPEFPSHLIHGFFFRAHYLGSTQLLMKRPSTRKSRLYQAKEALFRVKDPDGDHQPRVAIELFISVERIMIMDHALKEILIDHDLRTVSYISNMGEVLVMMALGPSPPQPADREGDPCHPPTKSPSDPCTSSTSVKASSVQTTTATKLLCHVLECDEAQLVAQSVNHAFQLAYLDYLREIGVKDLSTVKHLRYQDAVNEQEIFCDELASFCNEEKEKQVTVVKQRGEPLGLVIVSSGWGSLLPTALLANMQPTGPAARCGQLNIGNRIIAVDGQSLVGLSHAECQSLIKACRNQTSVTLTVVDCAPVTEVFIQRPSVEQHLGFSVQDGVICSLLRGGLGERGGIRVDHRIIEINDESVVAMPHEYIVRLLSESTGEIHIRTMPTTVFRLLTGQETPKYI